MLRCRVYNDSCLNTVSWQWRAQREYFHPDNGACNSCKEHFDLNTPGHLIEFLAVSSL